MADSKPPAPVTKSAPPRPSAAPPRPSTPKAPKAPAALAIKAEAKAEEKLAEKAVEKVEETVAARAEEPIAKAVEAKPVDLKVDLKADVKAPEATPEVKPIETVAESANSDVKPEVKPEIKVEVKPVKPVAPPAPVLAPAPKPAVMAPPLPPPVARVEEPARKSMMSIFTWDAFKPDPDPLAVAKMTPAVMQRRARLTKYVKGVVAGCAALCLIALVRVAVASESDEAVRAPLGTASALALKVRAAKSLQAATEEKASDKSRAAVWAFKSTPNRHR